MPKPLADRLTQWEPANLPLPVGAAALVAFTRPAMAVMAECNGKLLDGAAEFSVEWTNFLRRRLQEDLAMPQRLASCKGPQEAQQVCADYWRTAFSQYQDEMGRLARMGQSFAERTATAIQKRAKAAADETQIAA